MTSLMALVSFPGQFYGRVCGTFNSRYSYHCSCQEEIDARASICTCALVVRVIARTRVELHMQSTICVSEVQGFLLLKHVKCLI